MTMKLYDGDYCVRLTNMLQPSIYALTIVDESGFFNIYINARLSFAQQRRTFRHEVRHIERGDFFSYLDIAAIEAA